MRSLTRWKAAVARAITGAKKRKKKKRRKGKAGRKEEPCRTMKTDLIPPPWRGLWERLLQPDQWGHQPDAEYMDNQQSYRNGKSEDCKRRMLAALEDTWTL